MVGSSFCMVWKQGVFIALGFCRKLTVAKLNSADVKKITVLKLDLQIFRKQNFIFVFVFLKVIMVWLCNSKGKQRQICDKASRVISQWAGIIRWGCSGDVFVGHQLSYFYRFIDITNFVSMLILFAETGNKCHGLGFGPELGDRGNMSELLGQRTET